MGNLELLTQNPQVMFSLSGNRGSHSDRYGQAFLGSIRFFSAEGGLIRSSTQPQAPCESCGSVRHDGHI